MSSISIGSSEYYSQVEKEARGLNPLEEHPYDAVVNALIRDDRAAIEKQRQAVQTQYEDLKLHGVEQAKAKLQALGIPAENFAAKVAPWAEYYEDSEHWWKVHDGIVYVDMGLGTLDTAKRNSLIQVGMIVSPHEFIDGSVFVRVEHPHETKDLPLSYSSFLVNTHRTEQGDKVTGGKLEVHDLSSGRDGLTRFDHSLIIEFDYDGKIWCVEEKEQHDSRSVFRRDAGFDDFVQAKLLQAGKTLDADLTGFSGNIDLLNTLRESLVGYMQGDKAPKAVKNP